MGDDRKRLRKSQPLNFIHRNSHLCSCVDGEEVIPIQWNNPICSTSMSRKRKGAGAEYRRVAVPSEVSGDRARRDAYECLHWVGSRMALLCMYIVGPEVTKPSIAGAESN